MGAPYFSKFKSIIHGLVCVKYIFFQKPSKMTMDPKQRELFLCDVNGTKNSIKLKKDNTVEYKTY